MSQLLTHPSYPEIQFSQQEAAFLVWFLRNAARPFSSMTEDFTREVAVRFPQTEEHFVQRIEAMFDTINKQREGSV